MFFTGGLHFLKQLMIATKNIYRFVALTMALLMFFSSMGLAMDMHYCGGKLKSVSLFGEAKTCHELAAEENAPMKNCPHHKKMMAEKQDCSEAKNCCSNKTVHLQADQDQQVQNADFTVSNQLKQFVTAYVTIFFLNDLNVERETTPFAHYQPPLIPKDISILHQIFLL